nr:MULTISPECIES: lysine--tRNA ligase [Acutalibacteraceae]
MELTGNAENPENRSEAEIRREKLTALQKAGKDPFHITTCPHDCSAQEIRDRFSELENKDVCIAGRIVGWRDMGKAGFMDLSDRSGRIQVYMKIDQVGEESYTDLKNFWDVGDIISVRGYVFKTRRGEISVHAKEIRLLSKSLLPLPEKFHGLKDTDLRYRQRYLDLIMNPEVRDTFLKRSAIIRAIRDVLDGLGYVEVETPVLNTVAGGAAARPFVTHHNTLDMDMYLRIATELHLKRLIVGGMERVYEIGRCFRNEGMDVKHNPEYTSLELYEAYTDYHGMMDRTELLVQECARKACGTEHVTWQGEEIDLSGEFARLSMNDAIQKYAGIDFLSFKGDDEKAREAAGQLHLELGPADKWGDIMAKAFEATAEDKLVQPTFIYDYPVEVSPLTKRKRGTPELVERFELFINRCEFANAYSELNDPIDQRGRFVHQAELRASGEEETDVIDEDFLTAMEYGMPPTGGMGMGIDRLVMLLTDSASIRDVLLFPTMKPRED